MNKMENSRGLLSGHDLVTRGKIANECCLPEVGLKEVTPNGSWLEKKQVQAALEERKQLIDAERIDKIGSLSHAMWRDNLKLAEVTQQVGGHWQYLGHHVDKALYLAPEEALFLMESNCLLLKHNDVTVSLEKAYHLLLGENLTLIQYKVYASLSRVGYKVFKRPNLISEQMQETNKTAKESKDLLTSNQTMDILQETDGLAKSEISQEMDTSEQETKGHLNKDNLLDTNGSNLPANNAEISEEPIQVNCSIVIYTPKQKELLPLPHNYKVPIPLHDVNHVVKNVETADIGENSSTDTNNATESNFVDEKSSAVKTTAQIEPNEENASLNNTIDSTTMSTDEKISVADDLKTVETNVDESTNRNMQLCCIDNAATHTRESIDDQNQDESEINEPYEISHMDIDENDNESIVVVINNNLLGTDIECPELSNDKVYAIDEHGIIRLLNDEITVEAPAAIQRGDSETTIPGRILNEPISKVTETTVTGSSNYYKEKLQKYNNRKTPPSNPDQIKESFKNIPDLCKKESATIESPSEDYIPRNVFLNHTRYTLNMETVRMFTRHSSTPTEDRRPTQSEMPLHARASAPTPIPPPFYNWQAPNSYNPRMFNFSTYRQRQPFRPYANLPPLRIPYYDLFFPRHSHAHPYYHRPNANYIDMSRRGPRVQPSRMEEKSDYLNIIRSIANRLKQLPSPPRDSLISLRNVINTYNAKYNENISVTHNYNIIENASVIELDADEPASNLRTEKYEKYLSCVKKLAARLKNFERKNQPSSKQKRALNNLIKHFNKAYHCDLIINRKGDLIDRKVVVLDSSSDSDVAVAEVENKRKRKSMLVNPFSMLKMRRTEATSSNMTVDDCMLVDDTPREATEYNRLLKYFDKNWLPDEDDFGKAIPCSKSDAQLYSNNSNELYEFSATQNVENWQDLKVKFLTHMITCSDEIPCGVEAHGTLNPLLSQVQKIPNEDVWESLRVIKNNTDMAYTTLTIDFDVYNRDVQNFKKSKRPKPHFKIVCVDESSRFPSGAEVRYLHAQSDDTMIVFAVVGLASISYLQVNPKITAILSDLEVEGSNRKRTRRRAPKH